MDIELDDESVSSNIAEPITPTEPSNAAEMVVEG